MEFISHTKPCAVKLRLADCAQILCHRYPDGTVGIGLDAQSEHVVEYRHDLLRPWFALARRSKVPSAVGVSDDLDVGAVMAGHQESPAACSIAREIIDSHGTLTFPVFPPSLAFATSTVTIASLIGMLLS